MKRNNSLSDTPQEVPMPDRFTGGSKDFGINRAIDGHDSGSPSLDNNVHSPNY